MQGHHRTEFGKEYWLPRPLLEALERNGWEDVSWHNDACSTFESGDGRILFADCKDPGQREGIGEYRYEVRPESRLDVLLFGSDSTERIIAHLEGKS